MASSGRIHIAINREGGLFIFFVIALGAAAVYSGSSGLVLFFCAVLAVCILACVVARRNLREISIERRFVEEIFARRESRVDLLIRNTGKKTIYGLHVYDTFELGRRIGPVFVRQLGPGETATARYMCEFPSRGVAQFCGFQVRSRFPIPFLEFRLDFSQSETAYVFPEPLSGEDLLVFAPADSHQRSFRTRKDDQTIRELVHGRRCGRILWKLSARRQIWLESVPVRRSVGIDKPAIYLRDRQTLGDAAYERQISQVTGFALKRIGQNQAGAVHIGQRVLGYGATAKQRRQLLETLAEI